MFHVFSEIIWYLSLYDCLVLINTRISSSNNVFLASIWWYVQIIFYPFTSEGDVDCLHSLVVVSVDMRIQMSLWHTNLFGSYTQGGLFHHIECFVCLIFWCNSNLCPIIEVLISTTTNNVPSAHFSTAVALLSVPNPDLFDNSLSNMDVFNK